LLLDCRNDVGVPVPQARHRCATRRIDIPPALPVEKADALAANRELERLPRIAMKNVCHEMRCPGFNKCFINLNLRNKSINIMRRRQPRFSIGMARKPQPPRTLDSLVATVRERYPDMSPQFQIGARHLIDFPERVPVESMRRIAAQAGVQPATLVRLAQSLGYTGWEPLRQ